LKYIINTSKYTMNILLIHVKYIEYTMRTGQ
jgi:hypothetical protein